MILEGKFDIKSLSKLNDSSVIRQKLLELDGVGPKVADCILLFGFKRYEVFPIDVWVRRVMNNLYIKNEEESKVSRVQIEKLAVDKYGKLAGLAQQYLFYLERERSKTS